MWEKTQVSVTEVNEHVSRHATVWENFGYYQISVLGASSEIDILP